jgi:hypothetical protein
MMPNSWVNRHAGVVASDLDDDHDRPTHSELTVVQPRRLPAG